MINMVKLPTSKSELFLRVAKGHFATSHSHIRSEEHTSELQSQR